MTNYSDLKADFRMGDDGDAWGHVMIWWFHIADEIEHNRIAIECPVEWQFRPSPMGQCLDDDYMIEIMTGASDDALARMGALCDRYASKLRQAGRDY